MKPQRLNEPGQRLEAHKDTRAGDKVRQCAVTRERLAPDALIRFVRSPDGIVVPDSFGKLPGRGAWIAADRETLHSGVESNVFSRAFKAESRPMDELIQEVERQLLQRCIGLLGMAKKSGVAVLGFDQVRDYIRKQPPGLLLEASDGAEDGRNKVHFLAKAIYEDVDVAGALSSAELRNSA